MRAVEAVAGEAVRAVEAVAGEARVNEATEREVAVERLQPLP